MTRYRYEPPFRFKSNQTKSRIVGTSHHFANSSDPTAFCASTSVNLQPSSRLFSSNRRSRINLWPVVRKSHHTMSTMLRPVLRSSRRHIAKLKPSLVGSYTARAAFGTQSGDDAKKSTVLAKLYLEDGTTLTGRSFGCHTSIEGEVSEASHFVPMMECASIHSYP